MNIYELTQDFLQLTEMLESGDYDEQTIADTMESLEYDIEEKADGYGKAIRNLESDIEGLKSEVERITARIKAKENAVKRMKESLFESMKAMGKKKIDTPLFSYTISKAGGSAPLVLDKDVDDIPIAFLKIQKSVDKKALSDYMKETGDMTYAHFGERTEYLRMK